MRAGDGEEDRWTLIPITSPSLHPDSLTQESMCKCLLNPDFSFRQQLLGFVFGFFLFFCFFVFLFFFFFHKDPEQF